MADFFESIQPLIVSAEQQGSTLNCVFQCPVTGETVQASAPLQKRETMMGNMAQNVGGNVVQTLKYSVASTIRRAMGFGFVGYIIGDIADSLILQTGNTPGEIHYSEEEKKDALARAFQSADFFVWDNKNSRWISANAEQQMYSDFERQLNAYPVTQPFDQAILARILIAIANADGQLAESEKNFFAWFIDPQLGSLESLSSRPMPSPVELEETTADSTRETIMMLAWSLALADEQLDQNEVALLGSFAQGLGIPLVRHQELMRYAQNYLLERVIGQCLANGQLSPAYEGQILAWSTRIGLDAGEAQRVLVQYKKRHGLY
ncbi:TerB family tellurite resistance protein [Gloeobacter kilaueensis]|uniref:Uncharacterized protein n=1 Tax=Gloeobacter kilaueensis (strain ATCC BAA-2537 / CCAP 1431/1 / ULC 316 / JS1) TaxID=1183438 RepID=U5QNV0_GLOK1|nr:TerB family tellurite resistance protein [Gloeobacter kilaueensis]AGY60677.1 hypothetical protein GKIL_4431 [Gloeobacter kilaueensis JS1]